MVTKVDTSLLDIDEPLTIQEPVVDSDAATKKYVDDTALGTASAVSSTYVAQADVGVANGVASLDSGGKVPTSELPALAITDTSVVASASAMLALVAQTGDVAVRTDESKSYILTENDPTILGNWQEIVGNPDAGTLDGLDSTQFLRSDVADIMDGDLTFPATRIIRMETADSEAIITSGEGDANIAMKYNATVGAGETFVDASVNAAMLSLNPFNPNVNLFTIRYDSGAGKLAGAAISWQDVFHVGLTDIKYQGNNVWHAGNDGVGSGLDADLLDGNDSPYYTNANNLDSGTIPGARFDDTSHGNRGGGALHANANGSSLTAGFISGDDQAKLDGIQAGATVDQTGGEIKALYEAELDTNAFTNSEKAKLGGIEVGATADQTGAEIKSAYEAEANTNAFTDAEKTSLAGLTASAVTDTDLAAQKGVANGIATLDAGAKIPTSQLPALAISETSVVASASAMLALTAQTGDVAVRTDESKSYILAVNDPSILGNWQELSTPVDSVASVNGQTGVVVLDTDDVTEATNLYYTEGRVDANSNVAANTAARHTHANSALLDATTASYTTSASAKLAGIESGATADQTGAEIKAAYEGEANTNAFTDAEQNKLLGIEAGAEVNPTGAEIKVAYESELDTNAFTDAEKSKLLGIEVGAEQNRTAASTLADIKSVDGAGSGLDSDLLDGQEGAYYLNASNMASGILPAARFDDTTHGNRTNPSLHATATSASSGFMASADKSKLDGIESGATADQTGAEIKAAYEGEANTNAYTDAAVSKLAGIESGATADQTGAEIKVAYEAEANTNAYTDAEKTKLAGIEAAATADQTGAEIKALYEAELNTNVDTADALSVGRSIGLGGDLSGSATFDGSANITITAAVANDSHTHDTQYYTKAQSDSNFVDVSGDVMASAANLTFVGGGEILGLPATPSSTGAASKEYVDALVSAGSTWRNPVLDPDVVDFISSNPATPEATYGVTTGNDITFIVTGTFTAQLGAGASVAATPGDIINLTITGSGQGDYSILNTPLVVGDRFIVAADHGTVGSGFSGFSPAIVKGDLIEFTGAGTGDGSSLADWSFPEGYSGLSAGGAEISQGITVLVSDPDSTHYGDTLLYDATSNAWVLIAGPGSIVDGNQLTFVGNVLNVDDGAGSGLDADLLDGQEGAYYRNATNLNAGTLPAARFNDTAHGNRGGGSLHSAVTTGTDGFMSAADKVKLNAIESGATADQTGAEIKAAYEGEANTNAFTDAEQSKLAGIESGATADQSAGEILAALLTVDGAGSGLDADLLDGLSSGSLIRSDADDSFSGQLSSSKASGSVFSFDGGHGIITVHDGGGNWNFRHGNYYATGDKYKSTGSGAARMTMTSDSSNGSITIGVAPTGSAGNAITWAKELIMTTGDVTIDGNSIWHAGNDGAGSGLDADLLDGSEGSFYRNAGNLNAGTLPAARFNDTAHGSRSGGALHSVATVSINGFMSSLDKTKLDGIESGATADQTASEILTLIKTVDGAGSGLDADTLDGLSSASFFRTDINTESIAASTLNFTGAGVSLNGPFGNMMQSRDEWLRLNNGQQHTNGIYCGSSLLRTDGQLQVGSAGATFLVNGATITHQGNTIWTAGNDGAGSGLDADTVDGLQASQFLRSDGADTHSGTITPNVNNTINLGSGALKYANVYATTFQGEATSARFADLAERYEADMEYKPGTVVIFAGNKEITACEGSGDTRVAGVISTDPAFMMNADAGTDATHPYVALKGRVPCKVVGKVAKGALLTTSGTPGHAMAASEDTPHWAIFAKAIEASDGGFSEIEVVVQ